MTKGKKSDKIDKNIAKRTLYYYWQIAKRYKWHSLGVLIITPITILISSAIIPLIFANMVGMVASDPASDQLIAVLLPQGLLLVGLYLVGNILLDKLKLFLVWKVELQAEYDLADKCFTTVSSQSMQFHSDRFSGSLVSQTNKFTYAFSVLFDELFYTVIPLVLSLIFIIAILLPRAPLFTIILITIVAIYATASWFAFRRIRPLNEAAAEAENKQTGQLADSVTNILSVKSYGKEQHERKRYMNFRSKTLRAYLNVMSGHIKRDVIFGLINCLLIAAVVFFIVTGKTVFGLSVATLVLILTYSQQIINKLWDFSRIFKQVNRVFGDAKEMTEILDAEDTVVDTPNAKKLKITQGAVKFTAITFQHQDAKQPIFQGFNLDIKPGERVGLVGISGSGKTTLTKLLLRFADVSAGEITIDDQDLKTITQTSLRENIAYVPQETALFHRSIAENIAYARPNASQKEIERAAKLANAHEFIKDLPDGYDTLVGERGIKLSGGQRQRVAIARAILKDAPILVLDEATSALDSESEALIQDALVKLMKGRTSIVVAHRLSTIADMDRIVVLENGKIVEQGSHLELVKKNGAYSKLWNRQSGAFIDEN